MTKWNINGAWAIFLILSLIEDISKTASVGDKQKKEGKLGDCQVYWQVVQLSYIGVKFTSS